MRILCAYNANIDAIFKVNGMQMSALAQGIDTPRGQPGYIVTKADFFEGLFTCMEKGTGAEWVVRDEVMFEWLRSNFLKDAFLRMGGNMGIMANALSELGAGQVIPNVPNPSPLQLSFFKGKNIFIPPGTPLQNGHNHGHAPTSAPKELIHFVFDFSQGDTFMRHGKRMTVPRGNRFIATYDPLNFELFADEHFSKYALDNIKNIDGAVISGLHLLRETYPDGSTYKEKLIRTMGQLASWKEANKKLRLHVELGHFISASIASDLLTHLAIVADSIGVNEDELAMLASLFNIDTSGILEMDANSIVETTVSLCKNLSIKSMLVHTKEFVVSVSLSKTTLAENTLEALQFGISCAAAFACTGSMEDRDAMLLKASRIMESDIGKTQMEALKEKHAFHSKGSGVSGEYCGCMVCAVPTRLCNEPLTTVGLGDTVSSAIFLRELELCP